MSRQNVDVVRGMFDAYRRGDNDALAACAHPDVEIFPSWDSTKSGVGRGHKELLQFWHGWESEWDDYHIEPREFHDAGENVVVVIYERGRGRLSGVTVEDEFAHMWSLREGKVASVKVFTHKRDALAAAGLGDKHQS